MGRDSFQNPEALLEKSAFFLLASKKAFASASKHASDSASHRCASLTSSADSKALVCLHSSIECVKRRCHSKKPRYSASHLAKRVQCSSTDSCTISTVA